MLAVKVWLTVPIHCAVKELEHGEVRAPSRTAQILHAELDLAFCTAGFVV